MVAPSLGISIIMQWGKDLPVANSSSKALSIQAVSLWPADMMGRSLCMSSPNNGEENRAWRATIQFKFPRRVLISPLWATSR